MAALVCDICGGKLVMGSGGIAVCDSCGMEHSPDRMKEKIQEVKGTVRVDNSHMINNYLEMANTAYEASNLSEAESYCNKVIEIEPINYRAWFLKGKAAGWQSTLQNLRISESASAFTKAIGNAPDDENETLFEEAKTEMLNLSIAIISLRGDRFAKWPDEEEKNGFSSDIIAILNALTQFVSQVGVAIPLSEIMAPIATAINQSVITAFQNVVFPDYDGDPNDSDDRAGKYEWQNYIERIGFCTELLNQAIELCDEDDEEDIQRYENLIYLHEKAIDSCSWDYDISEWGWKDWHKEWSLTDDAKRIRREMIADYRSKITAIMATKAQKDAELAKARFDDYWLGHASDKAALESEKATLFCQIEALKRSTDDQISILTTDLSAIQGKAEIDNISARTEKLNSDKAALGVFKGKEKKLIQDQIDNLRASEKEIKARMEAERVTIQKKIDAVKAEAQSKVSPLQKRIASIDEELTKER